MPRMAEIFFLINHFWLCAAVVGHSQPQSKWLRPFFYKTLKRIQKKAVFGHFWKTQWVKLAKYDLKSTTRQYWIWISFYFYWKTLFLTYFLVYCKFLLYQAGTIVYPFIVQGGSFNWTPPQNHKFFETTEFKNFLDSNFFSTGPPPSNNRVQEFLGL